MAPEIVEGAPFDRRADIWSLGAVLYHLVTGRELFGEMSEADVMRALLMREPFPPPPVPLPPPVARVLDRALAFDPPARYPSAGAMAEALGEALVALGEPADPRADAEAIAPFVAATVAEPTRARAASIAAAIGTLARRPSRVTRRLALGGAAVASLLLAAAAALTAAALVRAEPEAVRAPSPTAPLGPEAPPAALVPSAPAILTPGAPTAAPVETSAPRHGGAEAVDERRPAKRPAKRPRPRAEVHGAAGNEFDTHD
jgi:eukaryotic-like serine/threonine-protein kinase